MNKLFISPNTNASCKVLVKYHNQNQSFSQESHTQTAHDTTPPLVAQFGPDTIHIVSLPKMPHPLPFLQYRERTHVAPSIWFSSLHSHAFHDCYEAAGH